MLADKNESSNMDTKILCTVHVYVTYYPIIFAFTHVSISLNCKLNKIKCQQFSYFTIYSHAYT